LEIDGKPCRLELSRNTNDGGWTATLDGERFPVDAQLTQPGILSLIYQGHAYRCVLDEGPVETAIQIGGQRYLLTIDDPRSLTARRRKAGAGGGMQVIKAPMPGRIVRLLVAPGDRVAAQQGVVVIEAMKMQNELKAMRPGKIVEIRTEAGATVAAGAVLLTIE
jgi:biotin carboxyl carrier protein